MTRPPHDCRAPQNLELSLKKAEESLPRLASESASQLEKFHAEAKAFAGQLRSELESAARESSAKASEEISEKLEGSVESALEVVVRDFNKQAEEALELLKEGFRPAREQCVEETQKQLGAARESVSTALESEASEKSTSYREQIRAALAEMQAQQTKEVETRFRPAGRPAGNSHAKIHETQEQSVEETQKQLSAVRESAMTALESEASEKSSVVPGATAGGARGDASAADKGGGDGDSGQPGRPAGNSSRQDPRDTRAVCRGDPEAVKCSAGIGHDRAGERSLGEVDVVPGATARGARGDASAADKGDGDGRFRPAWKACWKLFTPRSTRHKSSL